MFFDPKTIIDDVIKNIRADFLIRPPIVVPLNADESSIVCAALCTKAYGKENVEAIIMPDINEADCDKLAKAAAHIGISSRIIPVSAAVADIYHQIEYAGIPVTMKALQNLPADVRGSILRTVATSLEGCIVNANVLPKFNFDSMQSTQKLAIMKELDLEQYT